MDHTVGRSPSGPSHTGGSGGAAAVPAFDIASAPAPASESAASAVSPDPIRAALELPTSSRPLPSSSSSSSLPSSLSPAAISKAATDDDDDDADADDDEDDEERQARLKKQLRRLLPPQLQPRQSQPEPSRSPRACQPQAQAQAQAQLPTDVSAPEQLASIPPEFLSGVPARPLRYCEDDLPPSSPYPTKPGAAKIAKIGHGDEGAAAQTAGEGKNVCTYALRPMTYGVAFILLVELLERFCFYGVQYTQTSYLTGAYNEEWNAGMTSVQASSLVSISTAVAYSAPFLGALVADRCLGDYRAVLFGAVCLYIPGLALIACTTMPSLATRFRDDWLVLGLIGLWPVGTGVIKSIINVFGAKQFHPVLQSSLIESYYVNFYMCINIGALAGGIIIPLVAQRNVTVAYFIPVAVLVVGVLIFVAGSKRYVRSEPRFSARDLVCGAICSKGEGTKKKASALPTASSLSSASLVPPSPSPLNLSAIGKISALIVPFNVAYSQMATTFIVQGTVMSKALGWIDAASMNNCDAVSVLFFGWAIGSRLYPALTRRDIRIRTAHKFAIGSALGAMAIGWALVVEFMIKKSALAGNGKISVLWQGPAYVLIGAGEIFAVSSAYEVAFTVSPPDRKAAASATNLFFVGAIPNLACVALYRACAPWFDSARGTANISKLDDYVEASVGKYFALLFVVSMLGVALNMSPAVGEWLSGMEEKAADMIRTPTATPRRAPSSFRATKAARKEAASAPEEGRPLLLTDAERRHRQYLKHGKGPVLNRLGSMRAGVVPSEKRRKMAGVGARGEDVGEGGGTHKKYVIYGDGLVRCNNGSAVVLKGGAKTTGGGSLPVAMTGGNDAV